MKMTLLAAALSASAATFAQTAPTEPAQKTAYALGADVARSMKMNGLSPDAAMFAQGFKDFQAGKLQMTEEQMGEVLSALQRQVMEERQKGMAAAGEQNMEAAVKFLAENAKKEGVTALPSGLQYTVTKEGKGEKPAAIDTVKVNYTGKLLNGTVFDSSEKHGKPATFPLNGVIPGWTEGIQLLAPGAKATLFIPPNLAYGARGEPRAGIGPNSALIFDVELIEIVK